MRQAQSRHETLLRLWAAGGPQTPRREGRPRSGALLAGGLPALHYYAGGRATHTPQLRLRVGRPAHCRDATRCIAIVPPAGKPATLHCYAGGSSRSVCARLNHAVRNNLGTSTLCAIEHRPSYQSGPSAPGCNSRQRRARMGRIRSAAKPRRNKYPPNRR